MSSRNPDRGRSGHANWMQWALLSLIVQYCSSLRKILRENISMVSLRNEGRGSRCHFLEQDDEQLLENVILSTEEEPHFLPVPTVWVAATQLVMMLGLEIFVLVFPQQCCKESAFAIVVYTQVTMWAAVLLIDQYLRCQHRILRKGGYLQFYRQTQKLRRAPLFIFSAGRITGFSLIGSSLMLVIVIIIDSNCESHTTCVTSIFSPINYLQVLITIEVLMASVYIIVYLAQTVKFNKRQPLPDVNQEDIVSSFSGLQTPHTEIGYRDEDTLDEVVEKQADVIRYLKEHNGNLGKKILQLTAELNALKSV